MSAFTGTISKEAGASFAQRVSADEKMMNDSMHSLEEEVSVPEGREPAGAPVELSLKHRRGSVL